MMLKFNEPNVLAVKGLRQVTTHCPPHFEKVMFSQPVADKAITDWIWENLSGRFYYGTVDSPSNSDGFSSFSRTNMAAFEIASEASFFSLYLTQIS